MAIRLVFQRTTFSGHSRTHPALHTEPPPETHQGPNPKIAKPATMVDLDRIGRRPAERALNDREGYALAAGLGSEVRLNVCNTFGCRITRGFQAWLRMFVENHHQ